MYYNLKTVSILIYFENVIYFSDGKAEFSAAFTLFFSVTWSFRNHFNMLIWCSRNIYHDLDFLIIESLKEQHLFQIEFV